MAGGVDKGVCKRLRVDGEVRGRQEMQDRGKESSGLGKTVKESLGRGRLSNIGENNRIGKRSCPPFLLKVLGDEFRSIEVRALIGLGKKYYVSISFFSGGTWRSTAPRTVYRNNDALDRLLVEKGLFEAAVCSGLWPPHHL